MQKAFYQYHCCHNVVSVIQTSMKSSTCLMMLPNEMLARNQEIKVTKQHPVNYFYHLVATQDMMVLLDERFPKYNVSVTRFFQLKSLYSLSYQVCREKLLQLIHTLINMYGHKEPMATVEEPEQTSSNHSLIFDNARKPYRVPVVLCDAHDFTYCWLDPFNLGWKFISSSYE